MTAWTLTAYELPLRFLWKISRNASATKTNLVLQATQAGASGRGEAAPNVRYGETPNLLRRSSTTCWPTAYPWPTPWPTSRRCWPPGPWPTPCASPWKPPSRTAWRRGRGSRCGSGWACRPRPGAWPRPSRCLLWSRARWRNLVETSAPSGLAY
ncbi:MAG: hypothetical protein WKG07_42990 [Hymenobacter sp.]